MTPVGRDMGAWVAGMAAPGDAPATPREDRRWPRVA
jgi:hypothetical protein